MFMFGDEKIKNFYLSIFRRMEIKMKMNKKMLFLLYSNKKAYFFSLDAFIALVIILGVVLVVKPTIQNESPQINLQEDLVEVLSNLKIGEIDNPYAQQLISDGKIVNLNQSVLEQIGEFYAKSDPEANLLAQAVIDQLSPDNNLALYFNGIFIAGKQKILLENAKDVWTSRQIISGIQAGEDVRGYSSRAFLSSLNKIDYFYFGGYVGDGNISVLLEDNIEAVTIEAVFSEPFSVYINGQFAESYYPLTNIPYKIDLSAHINKFLDGINMIEFRSNENLYIAGGFIKVKHGESSNLVSINKKYLPGINGIINIYDSIYVPGVLDSMEIFLHYKSNYNLFMALGNKTVYRGNSSGVDASVTIADSELLSLLTYSDMNGKTIPLRLGLDNVSYVLNITLDADVFSVTDISGSMRCSVQGTFCYYTQYYCQTICRGNWLEPINNAKEANKVFIDAVLNDSDNRVGLVAYSTSAQDSNYHPLSNNNLSLKAEVDSWSADGSTCICCGINKAVQKLLNQSDTSKFMSLVVMSDGEANVRCSQQGTGNAKQDAIKAACDAYNNYGVRTYSVGFGEDADEATLQSISSCGHGSYYYGDVGDLINIYQEIAEEIIKASYLEQTVIGENIETKLYPDSYISLSYQKTIPYGLAVFAETSEFGNEISEGSFFVPNDTTPYEVKVASYSGSKWTDKAEIYNNNLSIWEKVFDLSTYHSPYINLGDPFIINLPTEKIIHGDNKIRVSTGLSPENSTGGSVYDKIIYTLVKNISSYSPIVASARGCIWNIEFEDGNNETIKVPQDYQGSENCYYTESLLAYNNNDAINLAVYNLLKSLDLNSNRKIETKFSESDVVVSSSEIKGIPFTWDTEVQARVWR